MPPYLYELPSLSMSCSARYHRRNWKEGNRETRGASELFYVLYTERRPEQTNPQAVRHLYDGGNHAVIMGVSYHVTGT
jgi:hypothetical protein